MYGQLIGAYCMFLQLCIFPSGMLSIFKDIRGAVGMEVDVIIIFGKIKAFPILFVLY